MFKEQKEDMEQHLCSSVVSTRQHYLHYDVRRTLKIHEEAGILVDSTQGYNRSVGFRAGTSFPYHGYICDEGRASSVLEVPMHVMDTSLFNNNALEYSADMALKHVISIMDSIEAIGGCLTLNWHPNYLNNPVWWSVYRDTLQEAKLRGAWGCSLAEMEKHWSQHMRRLDLR